jgi:hypothetical protein
MRGLVLAALAAGLAGCGGAATPPAGSTTPPTLGPIETAPSRSMPSPLQGTLETYQTLVADWQRARSAFFTAVTDGSTRSLSDTRALAVAYLRGLRAFAAGLSVRDWPPSAAPAVRELLAAAAVQQGYVTAMASARSAAAFTTGLAGYGTGAERENRAVAAAERALGG